MEDKNYGNLYQVAQEEETRECITTLLNLFLKRGLLIDYVQIHSDKQKIGIDCKPCLDEEEIS